MNYMKTTTPLSRKSFILIISSILLSLILIFPDTALAATGMNVEYRSETEIKNYINSNGAKITDKITYEVTPQTTIPYASGKLSSETLNSATAMVNQVRFIAGIDYDVTLDSSYNEKAQAATLLNAINDDLDHFPVTPDGMDLDLYKLGYAGAGSSNLGWASYNRTLNDTIIHGWMEDADAGNIQMVGHRRWVINPTMAKTGFGATANNTGNFTAMYSFDRSRSSSYKGVAWPAQNMPLDYFRTNYPWSISMGQSVNKSDVEVTITRISETQETKKVWTFSESNSTDGYFNVNNQGFGQTGCIIFRPNNLTLSDGDEFNVEITGEYTDSTTLDVSYTVSFFDLLTNISETSVSAISNQTYNGQAKTPEVIVSHNEITLQKDSDYTVTYKNNVNAGTGSAIITGKGEYKGTKTVDFTIVPKSASDLTVSAIATQSYTGEQIKPEPVVKDGDKVLTKGTDYDLSWSDNTNVGTATLSVVGKGNYIGNKNVTFAITQLSVSDLTVENVPNQTYTGANIEPKPVVINGNKTLAENTDYTLTWENNKNVGSAAKVNIAGIGNYCGTKSVSFSITPKNVNELETSEISNQVYSKTALTPAVTVTHGAYTLTSNDYSIEYKNNINAGTGSAIVKGKGNYNGEKSIDFTIQPKSLEDLDFSEIPSQKYTGSALSPEVTVKDGGHTLNSNDYTVEYSDNVNVGTGSAVIKGKGNYKGTKTVKFEITPKDIAGLIFEPIKDQVSTGLGLTPVVTVKDGNITLTSNDYDVEYSSNSAMGTGYAMIKGKGNYTGQKILTFKIGVGIEEGWVNVDSSSKTYNGKVHEPVVSVANNGVILLKGMDYDVEYSNNINAGTAYIIIKGKGNYVGNIQKTFLINKAGSSITLTKSFNKVFGDAAFNIGASLTAGNGKLSYSSNADPVASVANDDGKVSLNGPGKAVITVNGSETLNYKAPTPETTTIIVKPAKMTGLKTKSTKSKKATISWKKNNKNSGYQILMATNKKFTKNKKTVNISKGNTTKKSVSKLKKKKTYYVKVRAYKLIDGQKVWGAYSAVKKVKIK